MATWRRVLLRPLCWLGLHDVMVFWTYRSEFTLACQRCDSIREVR